MPQVKGFHPDTGEEIVIEFSGNFPLKDPETNVFVFETDDAKQESRPVFGGRSRERYTVLNAQGEEVLDDRPMAAAIQFSDHIPPEKKIQDMMKDANFRAQLRAYLAEKAGVDTYDEFDFDEDVLGTDGFVSPHEIIHDPKAGRNVPRFLEGVFHNLKKAVKEGTGPLANAVKEEQQELFPDGEEKPHNSET